MKWFLIFILSLFLPINFLHNQQIDSRSQVVRYRDKIKNKEIILRSLPDKLLVQFYTPVSESNPHKVLDTQEEFSIIYPATQDSNIAVYQVNDDKIKESDVISKPDVASAIPIYICEKGIEHYFLPNEFTVQFFEDISEEQQKSLITELSSSIVKKHYSPGHYSLGLVTGKDLFESIEIFNHLKEVQYAAPTEITFDSALVSPVSNTRFREQWALDNSGQNGGTPGADIKAVQAWAIEKGDTDVIIAIIDTGIDMDHPDLKDNILTRPISEDWNLVKSGNNDPDEGDSSSHGTLCAGVAAASDNNFGIVGIAPKCSILPIRINLRRFNQNDVKNAISLITDISRRYKKIVINCSWEMGEDTLVEQVIQRANSQGLLLCGAVGDKNKNLDVDTFNKGYPAAYKEVISVGATNNKDQKWSDSNYGKTVDVFAPGENILSTVQPNSYRSRSGTSFATPLVAGLAALIWSKNSTLSNNQVRRIIEDNCDNIDSKNPGFAGKLGKGRINTFKALQNTPNL